MLEEAEKLVSSSRNFVKWKNAFLKVSLFTKMVDNKMTQERFDAVFESLRASGHFMRREGGVVVEIRTY